MTLALLWEEYRAGPTDGFGYSWFCDLYRGWAGRLKPTMRQTHIAGEKLFVDFAGRTGEVIDGRGRRVIAVQIFVAVFGRVKLHLCRGDLEPEAAGLDRRACARPSHYFGGAAPADGQRQSEGRHHQGLLLRADGQPDLRRSRPSITAPRSSRRGPYKPRDKAKVEVGVKVVVALILARLRHRRFFSLAELNTRDPPPASMKLNDRPDARLGHEPAGAVREPSISRRSGQLPPFPYEYAEWKRCRVNFDYHVEIAKHYYSVPHQLIRQEVEARITATTVEIFHRGKRVASHQRSLRPHRPTTVTEHMPQLARRYRDWTHERIRREAASVGPDTAVLVDVILRSRPHPEQGFRSCIGILRLVKRYGAGRVDAACARALALGTRSYTSVAAILKNHREHAPAAASRGAAARTARRSGKYPFSRPRQIVPSCSLRATEASKT